jgi:uncharacterized membrane protein
MTVWERVRQSFIAGIVLIMPIFITLYILEIFVGFAVGYIDPVVQETDLTTYTANVEVVAQIIAAALILLVITLLGFVVQKPLGQRVFGSFGRTVTVVPIVRNIYKTVRQISTSFSSSDASYDSLVVIEYPREGIYSIGLITSESPEAISEVAGTRVQNVFLPSSPNPAGGRLAFVPEDQVYEVGLSVREGLGLIMTTGAGSKTEGLVPTSVELSPEEIVESIEVDELRTDDWIEAGSETPGDSTEASGERDTPDAEDSEDRTE